MRQPLLLTVVLLCSVLASSLTSCVVAHGNGASWTYAGLGADAEDLDINACGMKVKKLETSPAFKEGVKLVRQMWNAYLVQQGLQWIGGKYYDHQNAVVASDQAVKLEQLRNAKSAADAEAALKTLQETNRAAGAAAPAVTAAAPAVAAAIK